MPFPQAHAAVVDIPETKYARSGGNHIAYQTLGHGRPDIAFLGDWFSHVEARWDFAPEAASRAGSLLWGD